MVKSVLVGKEIRQLDDERHRDLIAEGFAPVSGKAEDAIVTALLNLPEGSEKYRLLKCNHERQVVNAAGGRWEVIGNDQVLYVKRIG